MLHGKILGIALLLNSLFFLSLFKIPIYHRNELAWDSFDIAHFIRFLKLNFYRLNLGFHFFNQISNGYFKISIVHF